MSSMCLFKCLCPTWLCRCWLQYEKSVGDKQSPIDIRRKTVLQDPSLNKTNLQWSNTGLRCTHILNTGRGWEVSVAAPGPNLRGGPLAYNYQLAQFHGHWSNSIAHGSEHTVDGEHYAGELHLVHYNADRHKSLAEATFAEEGLQVVGVFLKEGSLHPEVGKIVDCLSNVIYKGQKCALEQHLDVTSFIPDRSSYWTYEGSLTSPPWSENVTWIVYKEAIEVSLQQLQAFQKLTSHSDTILAPRDGFIVKNTRATQPLRGRVVREPLDELANF
ncbi:carbonic anhydrase 1-like [Amblyomma americanum]